MLFRVSEFECPECGEPAIGTHDKTPACALFTDPKDEGNGLLFVDFAGESEMDWDDQYSETDDAGRTALQCDRGHVWFAVDAEGKPVEPDSTPAELCERFENFLGDWEEM